MLKSCRWDVKTTLKLRADTSHLKWGCQQRVLGFRLLESRYSHRATPDKKKGFQLSNFYWRSKKKNPISESHYLNSHIFNSSQFLIEPYTLGNFWPHGEGAVYLQPHSSSSPPPFFFPLKYLSAFAFQKMKCTSTSCKKRAMLDALSVTAGAISSPYNIYCMCRAVYWRDREMLMSSRLLEIQSYREGKSHSERFFLPIPSPETIQNFNTSLWLKLSKLHLKNWKGKTDGGGGVDSDDPTELKYPLVGNSTISSPSQKNGLHGSDSTRKPRNQLQPHALRQPFLFSCLSNWLLGNPSSIAAHMH